MAAVLPYPDMDFVPLDTLTATELDHIVANYTYLKNYINGNMLSLTVTTTDPGEGAAQDANTIIAVV